MAPARGRRTSQPLLSLRPVAAATAAVALALSGALQPAVLFAAAQSDSSTGAASGSGSANSTDPCYLRAAASGGVTLPLTICTATTSCANWCWVWAITTVAALVQAGGVVPRSDGCSASACTLATELTRYDYYWTGESYNCCSYGCNQQQNSLQYCQRTLTADTLRYMLAVHNVYGQAAAYDGAVTTSAHDARATAVVAKQQRTHPLLGAAPAVAPALQGVSPVNGQLNSTELQLELSQLRPVVLGYGGGRNGLLGGGQILVLYGYDGASDRFLCADSCTATTLYRSYAELQVYGNYSWTVTLYQLTYGGYCNPTTSAAKQPARASPLWPALIAAVALALMAL